MLQKVSSVPLITNLSDWFPNVLSFPVVGSTYHDILYNFPDKVCLWTAQRRVCVRLTSDKFVILETLSCRSSKTNGFGLIKFWNTRPLIARARKTYAYYNSRCYYAIVELSIYFYPFQSRIIVFNRHVSGDILDK